MYLHSWKGIDKQGRKGRNNSEILSNDIQCDERMLIGKVNKTSK